MFTYTTPTIPATIPDIDFSNVDYFRIKIASEKKSFLFVVNATDSNVDPETNTIYIELTQEQTAELEEGFAAIQARIIYLSGKIQATKKAVISIEDVLDKVII